VAIDDAILHVVCPELPFGGVGESGMGAYNGKHLPHLCPAQVQGL
jgi:aldehyde dehydrogenase (NAD+)